MAKFLSHIMTAASGSVGETTYSRNRNGMYFRQKSHATQPNSPAQQHVRAAFTAAAQAWRGLSEVQRAGWRALGMQMTTVDSLGQPSTLTGLQAFVSLNGVHATTGSTAVLTDAPSLSETAGPLPTITLTAERAGTSDGLFSLTVQSTSYTGKVQVYVTPPVSAGRDAFEKTAFRLLKVVDGLGAGTTSLTTAYSAKYGAPAVGTKVAVKLIPISPNGIKGAKYVATSVVSVGS